jgi:hypothetical protein
LFGKRKEDIHMKKQYAVFLFSALGMVFFSCTDFFSTTLAPWAARDLASLIPDVTVDNVADLITQSEGNPDMSYAVLENIQDAMAGASAAEASVLQAAALQAAANASNLGPALISQVANITEVMDDPDAIANLVTDTINELTHLGDSSAILLNVLPDPGDTAAFDAFVAETSPDDLAVAAALLLASEVQSGGLDDFATFDPEDAAGTNSDTANLAVALAQAAMAGYEAGGSDSRFKDILDGLNLNPPAPVTP